MKASPRRAGPEWRGRAARSGMPAVLDRPLRRGVCRRLGGAVVACFGFAAVTAGAEPLRLEVEGVDGALAENVRAYIGELPEIGNVREARAFADRSEERAGMALQALGHYRFDIDREVDRAGEDEGWTLRLDIDPGEPVRLREVEIRVEGDGEDDTAFADLIPRLPLREGDVLHHGEYESSRNALRSVALSRGYFDHELVTHEVQVQPSEGWADVTLVMETGKRYRLGEVRFGDSRLDDDLLRRLVPFEPGTPYDTELIGDLNTNLNDSGYFESVRVLPEREDAEDGTIPVDANLTLREPNTVGFGIGYSTDEGARGRVSWDRPWHNEAGHQIFSDFRVSEIRQNLGTRYVIPLEDPLRDRIELRAGLQQEDLRDTFSRRAVVGIERHQLFDDGWERIQSLRLLEEEFEQADQSGHATLLLPGLSFNRTRSRGGVDPYWGDYQSYGVEVAADQVISDVTLARFTVANKWLRRFGENHRILLRGDAGAVATEDFEQVPSSLRFFAGGDQSIRGYAYESLSPEDDRGELLGGRYMVAGSVEYNYEFRQNWRAAVFTDAGNAFSEVKDYETKVGAGFGIRWVSPVGPVRLDFAWGVSESDPPFRVHISLGPPF